MNEQLVFSYIPKPRWFWPSRNPIDGWWMDGVDQDTLENSHLVTITSSLALIIIISLWIIISNYIPFSYYWRLWTYGSCLGYTYLPPRPSLPSRCALGETWGSPASVAAKPTRLCAVLSEGSDTMLQPLGLTFGSRSPKKKGHLWLIMAGGWLAPLKNDGLRQLGWWMQPNINMGTYKMDGNQTTNQMGMFICCPFVAEIYQKQIKIIKSWAISKVGGAIWG